MQHPFSTSKRNAALPSFEESDFEYSEGLFCSKKDSQCHSARNLKFRPSPPYPRKPLVALNGRQKNDWSVGNGSHLSCYREDTEPSPVSRSKATVKLGVSPNRIHGSPRLQLTRNISASKQKSYSSIVIRDISNAVSRIRHWSVKRDHSARSTWYFVASFLFWLSANLGVSQIRWYRSILSRNTAHRPNSFHVSETPVALITDSERGKGEHSSLITRKSAKFRGRDSHNNIGFPRIFDINPSRIEKKTGSVVFSILARRVQVMERHEIEQFPAEFSDNTQLYHIRDSSDIAIQETMELRDPYVQGECIPMKEWQTTFYPTCNLLHEFNLQEKDTILFGTKGYWRDAWKLERHLLPSSHSEAEKVVLKTLKYNHRFEDKYFEHNRIDAVAMERLTSSKHVMDVYSFCGNSVFMEYAGGPRLGTIADKARGAAKIRLARDIAEGIADVHSIDGEECATLTHFDINFSNIGVVNGSIKLNDFNIAVLRKWNTTSNEPCGFPSRYPNPQWRSPEEALDSQFLTEKVDVYSMGNIFFRLICRHEPWNYYEKGGKPPKEEITAKVQAGILPVIPDFILESTDFATVAIREAMFKAYTTDPKLRPSARSIANDLNRALIIAENFEKEEDQLSSSDLQ